MIGKHPDRSEHAMAEARGLVVCFGAGRVAGPLVAYLLRHAGISLYVASALAGEAEALCANYRHSAGDGTSRLTSMDVDVLDEQAYGTTVDELCDQADCVVALVPEPAQVRIAEACVRTKTMLVTASYPSPGIKKLSAAAAAAGVPILCEMGLDPGMDHMIAMKIIDDIKTKNGKIVGFSSVCGGLPAPDAANNPIKYKFSWSPLGALRAAQRPAQYLENGEVVTIPGADILGEAISVDLFPKHDLEQIPNGYSLPYADYYGIPDATSILRGTLRFKGFCSVIGQCAKIGLLDEQEIVNADTAWVELLASKLKQSGVNLDPPTQVFLHWLGINAPGLATKKTQSIMHSFCDILLSKLSFAPGERDLVLMQVGVKAEYPDGSRELIEALFESEGEPNGDTAMARTVGLTCAIGVTLLLEKRVHAVGVLGPTLREIYAPSLELLEAEGIHFEVASRPN